MAAGSVIRSVLQPVLRQSVRQNLWSSSWTPQDWYGISIDRANSSPDVTRISGDGKMDLHASLPVQSLMKACILKDDGAVNYYLSPTDWSKKVDGTASKLDGSDGNVMVEIPTYYRKVDNPSAGVYQHKISLYPISGFTEIPKFYLGAYKSTVNRTGTIKQWSIVNAAAEYRGGNNNATWDGGNNTLLGKPASAISLTNFRTYARNRGSIKWNVITWRHSMLLFELFIVEYATQNSQKAVNAALTVDGYRQGGLGVGVTAVDGTAWNTFNAYHSLIPCGSSNALASASGEASYTVPNFGHASGAVKVSRFRGIENPFGDIWEWCDGGSVFHEAAGGVSKFYTCDDPANFADNTAVNYDYRSNLPAATTYLKEMTHDEKGILIPLAGGTGSGSATYWCDYFYTPGLVNAWRALLRGGSAGDGAIAGFAYLLMNTSASTASANFGARLCYLA